MPQKKLSLLDKRIEEFFESTTELLTGIHARNKAGDKGASNRKRRMKKTSSKQNSKTDLTDK
jgi:hypothetical protein